MAMTDKSFNQVKNILGKLDRSIDELRSRRSGPAMATGPAFSPAPRPVESQNPARAGDTLPAPAADKPAAVGAPPARGAQFGRATPILPKQG